MGVRKKAVSSKERMKEKKERKKAIAERIASINNNQEDIHSMRVVGVGWIG